MTGSGITHEKTAKSIGLMSEGGRKQSLQVESCEQGTAYNLSNGRWRYAERPGTDGVSKNTEVSSCANIRLICRGFLKSLAIDMYNWRAGSVEDII